MAMAESRRAGLLAELDLPEITSGSAKQNVWATEIRDDLASWAIAVMDTLDRAIAHSAERGRDKVVAERTWARAALIDAVQGLTDATMLINFRDMLKTNTANAVLVLVRLLAPTVQGGRSTGEVDSLYTMWRPDNQSVLALT